MSKNNCKLRISCNDGILTASLCGELDHHGAVAVRTLIDSEILRTQPQKAVLELSELDFMDSSGIGLIMGRYALTERLGCEFAVQNPNERIVKIFRLAGLERMIKLEGATQSSRERRKTK